ncbi:methyl-accepting chemotaxis protein [Cohnella mopanensis]|uniref:methyl-accepting chemotaxis protein n=1 Tax=Cohnella mopanensis TaxID=2911966 RepID=UPI001EF94BD0|nr:methyl-accepting chemotaxis protein [Cohnella mopanensis]
MTKTDRRNRRSLRLKWMALISAAVLLSLLGSTFMLFTTVKSSLYETFSNSNAVQVESATREIRMMTEQYEKSVEQLAKSIEIASRYPEDSDSAIDLLLQERLAEDPSLLQVYFTTVQTGKPHRFPASNDQEDARETKAYKLALQNKETSWTDVHQDAATQKMMVSITTPITIEDQPYGIVGFDIDLNGIGALRESNEMFGHNKLVIYDNQGLIVTSFMKGMEGRNIDPNASGKIEGAQDVILDSAKMAEEFGWVQEITKGKKSGIQFQWENVQYSGEVSFVYSMDWSVISFVDHKALNSSLFGFFQMSAIAVAIGLFIGAFAAYYIATQLLRIIKQLRSTIAMTAEGDLVSEFVYKKNDEIGDLAISYNSMLHQIRALILSVNDSVNAVETTASRVRFISNENVVSGMEVARSTEEIAMGAANTSTEVEKSSVAVHRLSEEIGMLIGQSNEIKLDLEDSGQQVRKGNAQVENLELSYVRLERAFQQVTVMVDELNERSQSISLITKAIFTIAEQTNILSINASIEASRAGEQGRGFAVVANEVRNLASQARKSAKQIQETISVILSQTHSLVTVVSDTNAVNQTQKDAVSQVSQAMQKMNDSIGNMIVKVQEELKTISSIEGQKGVVVDSIENISSVSEQTTASTQEIASSVDDQVSSIKEVSEHANHLVELVAELKHSVSKFKVENEA